MLQFDSKLLNEMKKLYNSFKEKSNYELECRFIKVDKNKFYRALEFLMIKLKPIINNEVLDINTVQERITLLDIEDMEKFKNKKLDDISNNYHIIHSKNMINKNYNILDLFQARINLKEESKKNMNHDELKNILSDYQKITKYRLKKRISFLDNKNRWRYDLTLVKSSNEFSNLIDQDVTYEIEIEVLHNENKSIILKPFVDAIYQIYAIMYNDISPITYNEKNSILFSIQKFSGINFEKNNFIGPKPITLERKNILMPKPGIITIQDNYAVTEKADGIRTILFIDYNGKSYLINNSKEVTYTGVNLSNIKGTIVDGELVTKGQNNELIELFAIFDIYFYNENNVSNLPLIDENNKNEDRLYYMKQFFKDCNNKFIFSLYLKPYKYSNNTFNIFNVCYSLINSSEKPYKTDGLIFIPKNLPVGSNFVSENSNINGKTWYRNFKWKPEHLNTIDFLIKFSDTTVQSINTNSSNIQILNLYVAYNKFKNINCNYWIFTPIKSIIDDYYNNDNNTVEKLFIPPGEKEDIYKSYIQIIDDKIYTIEGQIIHNNSIVEFFYDDKKPDGFKWCPLKNRDDKTLIYQKQYKIHNTANYWDTAINIWKTIKFPVSKDILTNEKYASEDINIEDNDYYYDNYLPRDSYTIKYMNKFHNNVKRQLINEYCINSYSLMDIACGKAGDLDKWISTDIKKIYGIDLHQSNIEISDDSAYSRTLKRLIDDKKKNNKNYDSYAWVYITIDASQKINESYSYKYTDKETFDILYGIKQKNDKKSDYWKYCVEPFDNISCQFAIHYFFKCEDSLDNFIYNVDKHLKYGGNFIGTCLDGKLIKKKLKNANYIKGSKDNKTIWQINKKYNSDTLDFHYGETIEVYIESINQFIDEYLVNFDILEEKLKKFNIEIIGKYTNFKTYHDKYNIYLSDIEKELSFLNVSFVFRKKKN